MSDEVDSHSAADIARCLSWWGDVEFRNEESGEMEYHFGWNVHVWYADGGSQRYDALTIGELNGLIAHLGIEIECPPDRLDQVDCYCELCCHDVGATVAGSDSSPS